MLESLFSRRARIADTVALVDANKGAELSYSALDLRCQEVARNLSGLGVKKGDRVAALMENPVRMVVLFFALRKLGASLVPLNYLLKRDDASAQIRRASPRLTVDDFHGLGMRSEGLWEGEGAPGSPDLPAASLDDEALILFTGGSTGIPKGAIIHEGSVVWNAVNTVLSWDLKSSDVSYVPFPFYHIGAWGIYVIPVFFAGGKVIVTSKFGADRAIDDMHRHRVTRFLGVPTMLYELATSPRFEEVDLGHVNFGCGGGALNKELAKRYVSRGYKIWQGYGATETGPNNFAISPERYREKLRSVGKPMLFVDAKLADDGELLIRGPHVFKGYLPGEEAATAFDGSGYFHTGDVFSIDSDGDFAFVGRTKDMIKSGGENVYAAEVEQAINDLPGVSESAVIGIPDDKWGEAVVAYVVLGESGTAHREEDLKNALKDSLPSYKVPKEIRFVRELPRSAVGKIQKQVLRERHAKGLD